MHKHALNMHTLTHTNLHTQIKAAIGNWDTAFAKLDAKSEKAEEKLMKAAYDKLSTAVNATIKAKKEPKDEPKVVEAGKAVDKLRDVRKNREFPWLVAAYQAAAAVRKRRGSGW